MSVHEGIWIDQLCINQYDEIEKSIAIPVMDLVYGRAKVAVAILGEICINQEEIEVLKHIVQINEQSKVWLEAQAMAGTQQRLTGQLFETGPVEPFILIVSIQ